MVGRVVGHQVEGAACAAQLRRYVGLGQAPGHAPGAAVGLQCGGNAILGKNAQVKGNVTATSVSIEGKISGNILAKDKIEMKATATVNGDIKARRLSVEDGVTFVGRSEVNPNAQPAPAADSKPGPQVPQR